VKFEANSNHRPEHTMRRLIPALVTSVVLLGCDLGFTGPVKISSVTIEPAEIIVAENQTVAVQVIVRDAVGQVTREEPTWTSQDWYIATPSAANTIYAVSPGTTIIEATVRGVSGKARVTVTPAKVARISVSPQKMAMVTGQKAMLVVDLFDADGRFLKTRLGNFTASNASVSVTPQGLVTALAIGTASITVTVDDVSATVPVKVVSNTAAFDFYKRGGLSTPGVATLTYAAGDIFRGTLAIDGKSLPVQVYGDYDGVICMTSVFATSPAPDLLVACGSNASPRTIRLCTSPNGASQPQQLQYILMPAGDPERVPANASSLLAAVQTNTAMDGISVYPNCVNGPGLSRLVRNAPATDYLFWPNPSVYSATAVTGMLDGAVIFSAPNAGNDFRKYLAIRITPIVFEVWH
jgi:hypothetical protein